MRVLFTYKFTSVSCAFMVGEAWLHVLLLYKPSGLNIQVDGFEDKVSGFGSNYLQLDGLAIAGCIDSNKII